MSLLPHEGWRQSYIVEHTVPLVPFTDVETEAGSSGPRRGRQSGVETPSRAPKAPPALQFEHCSLALERTPKHPGAACLCVRMRPQ